MWRPPPGDSYSGMQPQHLVPAVESHKKPFIAAKLQAGLVSGVGDGSGEGLIMCPISGNWTHQQI